MKPSLKKYRRYAHRCQPLSPTVTDEEKNVQLTSSSASARDGRNKPRSISTPSLLKGMKWMFRKKSRKGSAKSFHNKEEELAEKGIQCWDANMYTHRNARVSGTSTRKGGTSSIIRRRPTNGSEQRRTSTFLGSVAATTVDRLIFGGTEKFERLKKANRDLEAACATCEDEAEIDGTSENQRGSSMPSMHLRPHSQRAKIMATDLDAPNFTHIFDPPAGGVQAWQDQGHTQDVHANPHDDVHLRPARSMMTYPSSVFDQPLSSAEPDNCMADHRVFSFDPSFDATLNLPSCGRLDEVSERRTLPDYETEDAVYDAQISRNVTTTSTDFSFVDAPYADQDSPFPCHDTTSDYDRPRNLQIYDEYDWEVASRQMHLSQDFCTMPACTERGTENPKTPDRRFPLRCPKYRHSVSRYSHNNLENIPPADEQTQPFYTPVPACGASKQRRARRRTMQPLSPLPNYSASRFYGGIDDTLDVPRKRPSAHKRPALYYGLDGAADEPDNEEQQQHLSIKDLPSTSRLPTSRGDDLSASIPRDERAKDTRRRRSGFTGLAGLMEVKATSSIFHTGVSTDQRRPEGVSAAAADDGIASSSASPPFRTRSRLHRRPPTIHAAEEEQEEDIPALAPDTSLHTTEPSTLTSRSPNTSPYPPNPPSDSLSPTYPSNLVNLPPSPSPSPSPSSIRYSSAHVPHTTTHSHSHPETTTAIGAFRSQSQSPKRRFSGPAGCERQRRRLRRVGTGMGAAVSRSADVDDSVSVGVDDNLEKRMVDRDVEEEGEDKEDEQGE